MFRGVSVLSLDAKGRIAMPTRYRAPLAERCEARLVVTREPDDPCLLIYPEPEWLEIEHKVMRLPSFHPMTRKLQRFLVGHATECEMDGQGRILIPPPLRGIAELDRRVMLIGQGNKFELWDEQKWNAGCEEWKSQGALDPEKLPPELQQFSL